MEGALRLEAAVQPKQAGIPERMQNGTCTCSWRLSPVHAVAKVSVALCSCASTRRCGRNFDSDVEQLGWRGDTKMVLLCSSPRIAG
ncbi:hypothetical protein NDU88_004832 [Pleurodeles waltl]|uniref:Uncharacterized protein n=1 Tax=Pleurodeles waltl TaxID=8319 RepID=A0AAV7RGU4_PLEWA|nr:hypothetical protein NDU88_004832 [Pleurodeles waltl]